MKNIQSYFIPAGFVFLFNLASSALAGEPPQMPPAQVSVVLAKERLLAPTTPVNGSVISLSDSQISTQVTGELQWLAAVGSVVKEKDIIARIDPVLLRVELQTAKAGLERLKADLSFREQEVKRFKSLAKRDNTSKARLQEEIAKRNMLLQDIRAGQANLNRAEHNLSQSEIKAPFSGTVVKRLASKGEFLSVGDQVIRLVDTFNKEIRVNAPMSLLSFLELKAPVQVSRANLSEQVNINSMVSVGDEISRMVEVRLSVPKEGWIIGSPVTVNLPSAPALTRITIPRDALIIKGSDVYIFRIDPSMKAEKIEAEIDAIDGEWVALKSKLAAGDQIVIRGGERLMPGQSVSILKE